MENIQNQTQNQNQNQNSQNTEKIEINEADLSHQAADLYNDLMEIFRYRPRQLDWNMPENMNQVLEKIRKTFPAYSMVAKAQRIARSVQALRLVGEKLDFVRLKYVCYGLASGLDWEGRRLIDDEKLIVLILKTIEKRCNDKRRWKVCLEGLFKCIKKVANPNFTQSESSLKNAKMIKSFIAKYKSNIQ